MKVLWTIIWSLLLGHMVYYVLGAMSGATYNFNSATIVGVVFAVFVLLLGTVLSGTPEEA
jgi:hypothetical protein